MRTALFALVLASLPAAIGAQPAPQQIPLWTKGAPGFEQRRNEPEIAQDYWVRNINNPSLTVYRPEPGKANGAAVVILPGGGHRLLVITSEGRDPGLYFAGLGVTAFVLKYRLEREEGSPYRIAVHALADTRRAIRMVRAHAAEWGVDPNRIGIMGFSAGGELVMLEADNPPAPEAPSSDPVDKVSDRPDFQILVYPGPLGVPATPPAGAPPAFLTAGDEDACCSPPTIALMEKLREAHVPVEFHLWAQTAHAFNMGQWTKLASVHNWPGRLTDWLNDMGILKPGWREPGPVQAK